MFCSILLKRNCTDDDWTGMWSPFLYAMLARVPDHQNRRGRPGPIDRLCRSWMWHSGGRRDRHAISAGPPSQAEVPTSNNQQFCRSKFPKGSLHNLTILSSVLHFSVTDCFVGVLRRIVPTPSKCSMWMPVQLSASVTTCFVSSAAKTGTILFSVGYWESGLKNATTIRKHLTGSRPTPRNVRSVT